MAARSVGVGSASMSRALLVWLDGGEGVGVVYTVMNREIRISWACCVVLWRRASRWNAVPLLRK